MSVAFGILLMWLSGLGVFNRFCKEMPVGLRAALGMLLGIALQSVFMFLFDLVQITFSQSHLLVANLAIIIITTDFKKLNKNFLLSLLEQVKVPKLNQLNIPAIVVISAIGFLFYIITVKCLFWPTTEHDAIGSFDKLGIVMALEGRIKVSLFEWGLQGAGGVYPPLFHGSISYLYLFGAQNPKILTTLFLASLLLLFYCFSARKATVFGGLFFTLLLFASPELFSHGALLLSNLPAAAYVAAASLALFEWIENRKPSYLLAALFMASCMIWIRNDLLPFSAGILLLLLWNFRKTFSVKWLLISIAFIVIPFVVWLLYVKLKLNLSAASRFEPALLFNSERIILMMLYLWGLIGFGQYGNVAPGLYLYGLSFPLFYVSLLVNFKNLVKDRAYILLYILFTFIAYTALYAMIDEEVQNAPLRSLMESSYKRGLFYFLPIVLYYAATNKTTSSLFHRLENFRTGAD